MIKNFFVLSEGVDDVDLDGDPVNEVDADCPTLDDDCTDIDTFISVAIGFDGTEIVVDHHEDGYELLDSGPYTDASTEIWGDGNCTNGFRPDLDEAECNEDPSRDTLKAGNVIVINNVVELPRNTSQIFYDGGDCFLASAPVTVARGAFPMSTSTLLAGAVELYERGAWGTEYVAPAGIDTIDSTTNEPFNWVELHIMAQEDDTEVTYADPDSAGTITVNLIKGQSIRVTNVEQGDMVTALKPVQVHFLAGDPGSDDGYYYELRWYALLPFDKWSNEYFSPVGVSEEPKRTRVWVYNHNDDAITVSFQGVNGSLGTLIVPGKEAARTSFDIPTGSGVRMYTDGPDFFAITQTDVEYEDGYEEEYFKGQSFDWGHPAVPRNQLTSQALIGTGWG